MKVNLGWNSFYNFQILIKLTTKSYPFIFPTYIVSLIFYCICFILHLFIHTPSLHPLIHLNFDAFQRKVHRHQLFPSKYISMFTIYLHFFPFDVKFIVNKMDKPKVYICLILTNTPVQPKSLLKHTTLPS